MGLISGILNYYKSRGKTDILKIEDTDIFREIVGYDDIKELLTLAIKSEDNVNILLNGGPGSGKSTFLKCIQKRYPKDSAYLDCSLMSRSGFRDFLVANDSVKILLLDEISRLTPKDQEILLNLAQDGTFIYTKTKRNADLKFNGLKIFATSNNIENLIEPIFDRFDNFNIPPYTTDQIYLIAEAKLKHKIQDPMIIRKIIDGAITDLKTKNIRDILDIAKVCKTESDVEKYISAKRKYS